MATTPYLGVPYPVGTDMVTDGDNAIKAVADFMDGTAWVAPALGAGWTTGVAPSGNIAYRKDGVGNVHVEGILGYTGGAPAVPAFTLPVGFRPVTWVAVATQDLGSGGASWPFLLFAVQTSGAVSLGTTPATPTANAPVCIVFSTRPRA